MLKGLFIPAVLSLMIIFTTSVVTAEKVTDGLLEYWTESDSELTPGQVAAWVNNRPVRIVAAWLERDESNEIFQIYIFDIVAPANNPLQVYKVRILVYRVFKTTNPFTLEGYTVLYTDKTQQEYRYNVQKDKYMLYDYTKREFKKPVKKDIVKRILI